MGCIPRALPRRRVPRQAERRDVGCPSLAPSPDCVAPRPPRSSPLSDHERLDDVAPLPGVYHATAVQRAGSGCPAGLGLSGPWLYPSWSNESSLPIFAGAACLRRHLSVGAGRTVVAVRPALGRPASRAAREHSNLDRHTLTIRWRGVP